MNLIIAILLGVGAIVGLVFSASHGRFIAFLLVVLVASLAIGAQAGLTTAGLVGWYEFVAFQVEYIKEEQKHDKTL